MAQTVTDEEIQLRKRARRRLVGAVAVVLLAVVFLPMILDKEPKPVGENVAIRIPSQDGTEFAPKVVPDQPVEPAPQSPSQNSEVLPPSTLSPNTPSSSTASADPRSSAANSVPAPAAAIPEPKPVAPPEPSARREPTKPAPGPEPVKPESAKTEPKPQPEVTAPKPESKPAAAASSETFVVQLGAFSNADNAKHVQDTLAKGGVKTYTEVMKGSNGSQTRVRAGPFRTREDAERTLKQVKGLGVNGVVMPANP